MDYITAVTRVVNIVKRPDKIETAKWAVNAAIADLVRMDTFSHDLYELEVAITDSSVFQAVDYTAFTNGEPRAIESVHTDNDQNPYTLIKPRNIALGGKRKGVYYKRNNGLQIKLRCSANTLKIAYYAAPATLLADGDTHWTLTHASAEVISRACYHVFATIGNDKDSAIWDNKSLRAYAIVAKDLE